MPESMSTNSFFNLINHKSNIKNTEEYNPQKNHKILIVCELKNNNFKKITSNVK